MSRIAFFFFLALGIFCCGCQTNRRQAQALWQKSLLIKEGMTSSEVYAIEPAPTFKLGTIDGKQMASWHSGSPLGNEEYVLVDVLFGKDDRVEDVHRERGHGHEPHDLLTWPW